MTLFTPGKQDAAIGRRLSWINTVLKPEAAWWRF